MNNSPLHSIPFHFILFYSIPIQLRKKIATNFRTSSTTDLINFAY